MGKFQITKRKDGEFQFNLKAENGEIILSSEGYTAKESCKKGIASVKKNSVIDERYDIETATNGKFYFNLKATNGEVIGKSQMYVNESGRDKGIASVKKNAPDAQIVDETLVDTHKVDASATGLVDAVTVKNEPQLTDDVVSSLTGDTGSSDIVTPTPPTIKDAGKPMEQSRIINKPDLDKKYSSRYVYGEDASLKKRKRSIWKLLLLLLALLILLFLSWRSCKPTEETEIDVLEMTPIDTVIGKTSIEVSLPDGKMIKGYKGGIEDQMLAFLTSDSYNKASEEDLKNKWFNFDNIDFKFGSGVNLVDGSIDQLTNIAEILKQFPKVKIKVGAYTDKVGDEESNMKLSAERANTIKEIFEKFGIGKQVVGTEGYGEQYAVHSEEASDHDRASDRKIALRFVK